MVIALPVFLQLAAAYAPSVAPETLAAFAQHESGLNPNTVHDNTTGLSYRPETAAAATTLAASMLAQGHSLDLGLMQINCANLVNFGLTVRSAFDPGESLRAVQIVPAIQATGVLAPAPAATSAGDKVATPTTPIPAMMEDLLHGGPPVPLSSTGLEDALPHNGERQ